mmetsp:Transcript_51298/g.143436  ORF Transcript_51298/g.143436 Transcript_51298/m.143436 type:complete len:284 (+) Transcript_51298:112-963(+)
MKWQMQRTATVLQVLVACLAAPGGTALKLGAQRVAVNERAGMVTKAGTFQGLKEFASAEAEDRRFWATEWKGLSEQLAGFAHVAEDGGGAEPLAALDPKGAGKASAAMPALKLNPKTAADLAPALAMLKGLYEDGKERIARLNARETEAKGKFAEIEAGHNATLARIEARFANHTLSAAFRANETRDEERIWGYWRGVRARQHRQYRTGLRIQHATLQKVKTMIDMYEKTMSGKADKKEVEARIRKIAPPEIVFLQEERRNAVRFCREALAELHDAVRDVAHQ